MDTPEPNPNNNNLYQQYVQLIIKSGFSQIEAEAIVKSRFSRLKYLQKVNPDKLAWIIKTKDISDNSIYLHLIKELTDKIKKDLEYQIFIQKQK